MTHLKTRFAARSGKKLRACMTGAERFHWSRLRNRGLMGFKSVRQQPVGPYIADIACRQADLVVELDGGRHAESQINEARTLVLAEHGYQGMRFWNHDVMSNLDGVLQILAERLVKAPSPGLRNAKPDLSPKGRGEGRPQTIRRPS